MTVDGPNDSLPAAETYLTNGWRYFDLCGRSRVFVWDPSTEYLARVRATLAWRAAAGTSVGAGLAEALRTGADLR